MKVVKKYGDDTIHRDKGKVARCKIIITGGHLTGAREEWDEEECD